MPIRNRCAELQAEMTAWRRDFHANPEVLFEVHRTAARVAELLRGFGCDEVVEGIGRTGVVGVIHGQSRASGRTVGLRADMDALPIDEATGLNYASTIPGVMHACGHDGHMAMLLGAAKVLAETRAFNGTAVVIFQPAEEGGAGGREMCRDGLMDRFAIDEVYGMHATPVLPVGEFAIRPGAIMAASDEFRITVTGKGAHAAEPHLGVDTTLAAAHILVALQSVAARFANPIHRVVVTVGTFEPDSRASNVIAQNVRMAGTLRSLDDEVRQMAKDRITPLVQNTARAMGASAVIDWQDGYPVTMNTPQHTGFAADVARSIGTAVDDNTDPILSVEDFAFMLKERPGAYIFIGNGASEYCHHPGFDFNDKALAYGASWYAAMAETRMPL